MKKFLKIFAALAAVVGTVYLIATYGEAIVAWAKKMLSCPFYSKETTVEVEASVEASEVEESAEEPEQAAAAEEAPVAEVAEESDFEN